ncbi:MAG TPA: GNAT family N-acetyltransferase [Candidatus Dormibacteraeota bacterium]|nr:GNAT family N-acetyltransferase [Candidatus Dormibacteraeota bacterium]
MIAGRDRQEALGLDHPQDSGGTGRTAPAVRRLERTEWPLLREVRLRALRDAPFAFGATHAETATRDDEFWQASVVRTAWFVAHRGDETVGMVAGLPGDAAAPESRELVSMWVAPSWRGAGVAAELVAAVCRWAQADGAAAVLLSVSEANPRARRFYERVGFRPTGARQPLRNQPGIDVLEMRRALA